MCRSSRWDHGVVGQWGLEVTNTPFLTPGVLGDKKQHESLAQFWSWGSFCFWNVFFCLKSAIFFWGGSYCWSVVVSWKSLRVGGRGGTFFFVRRALILVQTSIVFWKLRPRKDLGIHFLEQKVNSKRWWGEEDETPGTWIFRIGFLCKKRINDDN